MFAQSNIVGAGIFGDAKKVSGGGGLMLDGITTGIKAAYSTRKLLTAYAGNALQAKRDSDSTTQNIGFALNVLDTAALATFCSGTTCHVSIWYDQSGGGNNLIVDPLPNSLPIIYQSGAVNAINTKPALLFVLAGTLAGASGLYNAALSPNPTNTLFQNAVVSMDISSNFPTISGGDTFIEEVEAPVFHNKE